MLNQIKFVYFDKQFSRSFVEKGVYSDTYEVTNHFFFIEAKLDKVIQLF